MISNSQAKTVQAQENQAPSIIKRYEKFRIECIQNRRIICGKIVKVLPQGIVVDSGYTDLMRPQFNESWLIPGTVMATRPANLVEANQPDTVCVGLVFLTDLPKSPGIKPKPYDYAYLEGFSVGQYTYTSVGNVQRTVRAFTTKLQNAVAWDFAQSETQNAAPR